VRRQIVIKSDTEAEIHYLPNKLELFLGSRHVYSPIVREAYEIKAQFPAKKYTSWTHKYSGREISHLDLILLEQLVVEDQNLLEAMRDVDAIIS
jgi:hypothetical protein